MKTGKVQRCVCTDSFIQKHLCPYAKAFEGTPEYCRCCPSCTETCRMFAADAHAETQPHD